VIRSEEIASLLPPRHDEFVQSEAWPFPQRHGVFVVVLTILPRYVSCNGQGAAAVPCLAARESGDLVLRTRLGSCGMSVRFLFFTSVRMVYGRGRDSPPFGPDLGCVALSSASLRFGRFV
jgi:hypothetical protein